MRLEGPFAWLSHGVQVPLCLALIVAALAFGYYLGKQGAPLGKLLPHGVLDIEMPWSTERAQEVNKALGEAGIAVAMKQTKLDFVFLVLYPLAISLTCALVAGSLSGKGSAIGMTVARAVLFAGLLDAVENVAMLQMLGGTTSSPWPQLSTTCALLKFTLVLGGLVFVLVGGLWRMALFFL